MLPFRARVDLGGFSNEGVHHIPETSSITEATPDCFVSYLRHSSGESNPSAEMQSVWHASTYLHRHVLQSHFYIAGASGFVKGHDATLGSDLWVK